MRSGWKNWAMAGACLGLLATGCGTEEGATGVDGGATDGVAAGTQAVALTFSAKVGAAAAACGTTYSELGKSKAAGELADARLFVSGVQLRDGDGTWQDVTLDDAAPWQGLGVALLDFEDGTGACKDSGTPETNGKITGKVAKGTYDAVRFTLGVPFEHNHIDSATAPSPLDAPGMFWVWQGGYKFLRVDWKITGGAIPRWNVHVGSTGCASADKTAPPTAPCNAGNRPQVELEVAGADQASLQIDLAALVAGADLKANVDSSPPGCMSAVSESDDCAPVWSALGMSFSTGACDAACAGQSVLGKVAP
jgi:uncharacterized repeat protein (TIGR04052 family)